ncbi:MAG TPA: nickel pincer cofactor biosynthesis protein LarC [Ktedonobacterales bacterium]|nr:nickel pincer cofactor biosynthesis protein LarC [Ktedonobacterales bacterium]
MLLWLDCFSGISGDMLLGALIDAGLDLDALRTGLAPLPLAGYTLEAESATEHGISGTRLHVRLDERAPHAHRRLADITALLDAASLPERAHKRALAVFQRLAEAEATIHGTTPDEVTFHEIGAVDSIVDIVGAALALDLLDIAEVYCSELPLTSGRVRSAHGALPVPAPATLELLRGTDAVWRSVPTEGELVTPTGAALVAALARFERPAMRLSAVGYGFGMRKLPWANCLRAVVGSAPEASRRNEAGFERDEVTVIEANIDNMTGETLGWLMEHLLASGALDVSYTPLQMKKNRPATLLTVIARPENASELAARILRESATLGVRMHYAERLKAGREVREIETPLGPVRVKLKTIGADVIAVTPEYDDCRALAERLKLPVETVMARVTRAARTHFHLDGAGADQEG